VQSYVNNIGLCSDVDVSAQIAAGAIFYDMEGFEITPQNGTIPVGFAPVFAERLHFPGGSIPATSTWGLTVLVLLVLVIGTLCFRRVHATLSRC